MKSAVVASLLIHVGGLVAIPNREPSPLPTTEAIAAASCRCDYELTITDARPPRALTLGAVPARRLAR